MVEIHTETAALPGGGAATSHILRADGITVRLSSLGATLMGIEAPDRDDAMGEVMLGWHDAARYAAPDYRRANPYFGATVGRFANRIAGAAFLLDGQRVALARNEGDNHLHGGAPGFDRALWSAEILPDGVRFCHVSPDGDQGYPGRLEATAEYRLAGPQDLLIRYQATTDRPTHVNLVSHGYFNLSGRPGSSIEDHRLWIDADHYLPIDAQSLPLGPIASVDGTPFDFRTPCPIGEALRSDHPQLRAGDGFNHNLVLNGAAGKLRPAARLYDPQSGRTLMLHTDQPGLQLYSGNALDGVLTPPFTRRSGLCLEAQHFPDTPNQPHFPSTHLDPGETYRSETLLSFATA